MGLEILNIYKNSKGPKIEIIPWNMWNNSPYESGSRYYTIAN
jgi:hypothetical protein